MVFNATFTIISVILVGQFYLERKPEYPEKTTNLPQVTDKLYHIMLYQIHLTWVGFKLTTLVGIGTDCTGSCKSNYHTIMTMTAPYYFYINFKWCWICSHPEYSWNTARWALAEYSWNTSRWALAEYSWNTASWALAEYSWNTARWA